MYSAPKEEPNNEINPIGVSGITIGEHCTVNCLDSFSSVFHDITAVPALLHFSNTSRNPACGLLSFILTIEGSLDLTIMTPESPLFSMGDEWRL